MQQRVLSLRILWRPTSAYRPKTLHRQQFKSFASTPEVKPTIKNLSDLFTAAPNEPFEAPKQFWANRATHRPFLDWAAQRLGLKDLSAWYTVTQADLAKAGGVGLVRHYYKQSLTRALIEAYPEHDWEVWMFHTVPRGWWAKEEHLKAYIEWLSTQLKISKPEDWYRINYNNISSQKGKMMLRQWNYDLATVLSTVYPSHRFLPWRFAHLPAKWWDSSENKREFFTWAAQQLGLSSLEDWYGVPLAKIKALTGSRMLLRGHGYSLFSALKLAFPDHDWKPWMFTRAGGNTMSEVSAQRQFFEWAHKQLGLQTLDGWYRVRLSDLFELGGRNFIVKRYKGSLHQALTSSFPEHIWDPLRFSPAISETKSRKQKSTPLT